MMNFVNQFEKKLRKCSFDIYYAFLAGMSSGNLDIFDFTLEELDELIDFI